MKAKLILTLVTISLLLLSCQTDYSSKWNNDPLHECASDLISNVHDSVVWDIPNVSPWCGDLPVSKSMINTGDCEFFVEEEGQGIPIILIHGGPGSTHNEFHPWFSKASKFARIIYYDQRGCGQSEYQPDDGYSVKQAVEDLENLRKKLNIDKWIVAGHSYGGFLAQYYTTLYPESVRGLVIICGSTGLHARNMGEYREDHYILPEERSAMRNHGRMIGAKQIIGELTEKEEMALVVFNNHLNGDWKRQGYYRPDDTELARTALYGWNHDFEGNFNSVMSHSMRQVDLKGAFDDCPIPTLIIESTNDLTWGIAKPMILAQNHPKAEIVIFTKSAHSPYKDEPVKFFEVLKSFVKLCEKPDPSSIEEYKQRLTTLQPGCGDPFLSGELTDYEQQSIDTYERVTKAIKKGLDFYDLSSPLNTHLSYISLFSSKDLRKAKQITYRDLTIDQLEYAFWLEETELWRIPAPPKYPHPGQIWPIYVINKKTGEWHDTLVFIFWDGEWRRGGNMGGPYFDWRSSELFFIKELLTRL